MKIWRHP